MNTNTPKPNAIPPSKVVQAYLTSFGQKNTEQALSLIDDNAVWHIDGQLNVSTVGLLKGKKHIRHWLENFPQNFLPRQFTISQILEKENDVIVIGAFRHLIKKTGNTIGSGMVIHFTVQNGLIKRYQIFEDSALLQRAFSEPTHDWVQQEIRINDTVYAYSDLGEGPVIIFAHGLFVDRTIFEHQVNELATTHRCIVLDMPGHSKSGFNKAGWTLDDIAEDILLMIEECSFGEQITFIGQSQGGMVGLLLAAKKPELISKLILIGTSARAEYPERIESWLSLRETLRTGTKAQQEQAFLTIQNRVNTAHWLEANPELAKKERNIMLSHHQEGITLALDAATINRKDIRSTFNQITAKTLVVCGAEDQATPLELSEEIAQNIAHAQLHILEGVAHHPPIEAPETLTMLITDFIKSIKIL
ncbi:alpha/beta fold hydrolase [Neisseria sp. Ec49-e6-T10]|uniref:alpha/beta fold hydrolase n=1 Tax=Neisseria sp. Ec49-e6-T10 TaxID=3140744 RepID=UPI003EBC1AAD